MTRRAHCTLARWGVALFILVGLLGIIGCPGGDMKEKGSAFPALTDVNTSSWKKLAGKRIFFGHQSVGANIIAGLGDLAGEYGYIHLRIVEGTAPEVFNNPAFLHAKIGSNTKPQSKIDAFSALVLGGLGEKTDIAFFKLCYLDITADTDVQKLFRNYREHLSRLKAARPDVMFLNITVPLTTVQTGIKAWIKKLLGKPLGGHKDNIKRGEFNDLLRSTYRGKEPIFDLAKIESTRPDGSRASYAKDGKQYDCLAPEYTDDGGHLNAQGRRIAAEQLLIFLAERME
ncbi:MAG: hypothetical protein FJ117_13250 [Deltaproteobacteria bacterium]|nr:hypothetical protein [Deltaproteobacteria bacterium]